jgi:phosphatidylserine/phosphatidylglycerophosphate/cardiolipin synthase-like enzyme
MDGVTPVEGNLDQDEGVNGPSHVKYLSVDGQLAIVGSANLDNQSFSRSREVNVVIDSADVVAAWDTQLFGAELKGAVPVDACR